MTKEQLAKYFDHTSLKPFATEQDIRKLCEEAKEYGFFSVCINPSFARLAKEILKNSGVKVCAVIGFPLGATTTQTKIFETEQAIRNGADEIDIVINIGLLKNQKDNLVRKDINAIVSAAKGKIVKVIIECCYLTDEEKKKACELAKKAGANFVKTSTGFGSGGATVEDVRLLKKAFGGDVKAAGGIKTLKDALSMIEAGATRIGASGSAEIIEEFERNKNAA